MSRNILVVDDEQSMRDTLKIMLEKEGFTVDCAKNGKEALTMFEDGAFDLIITDLKMPVAGGIELVEQLNDRGSEIPLIIMTAYATKEEAITALNLGATFFIEKPFKKTELLNYVNKAIKLEDLIRENRDLKAGLTKSSTLDSIIGTSKEITDVKEMVKKIAATESTVLITGESGTGKEMVARALHAVSNRTDGPFVAINCGAIPSELLESELFGHVRGSFTGAVKDKIGLMEMANGGTFFLDEVGNTALPIQMKILRAIQEREILPVGGHTPKKVDIRLIAATNESLEDSINRGEFRKDLYYRLNVINIHIPTLRERDEDIELLFVYFLTQKDMSGSILSNGLPDDMMCALKSYEWPGNIRELENIVERIVALSTNGQIGIHLLPEHIRNPVKKTFITEQNPVVPGMDDIEKAYIHWVLTQHGGQKQKAAEILGIGRSTLDRKIEKYGIQF